MKKVSFILCLVIIVAVCCFSSCNTVSGKVSCYVPDGAPSLAVANIVSAKKIGNVEVETKITTGEDVVAKCANGEADIAVLPTNAAVKICSLRSDYKIFTVNVFGLLYLVGTTQITNLQQLQGNTVYSIGLGNTPEYVFKKILDSQSVDYSTSAGIQFEYATDGSTIIPLVLQGKASFAVLGEPAVTNLIQKAQSQNKTVYRLFDLQKLWQEATQSGVLGYPQACMIVKESLLSNKNFAKRLQEAVFADVEFLQQNTASLNALMQSAGSSLDVSYTAEIIDRCNLNAVYAANIRADIEKYLETFSLQQFLPLNNSIFYEPNN